MKRRKFFQLLAALAGVPFLPKLAAKPETHTLALSEVPSHATYLNPGVVPTVPPGAISAWAGAPTPKGWLPCDGRVVSRFEYPKLWEAIGGADTFQLPDMNARVRVLNTWRRAHEGLEGVEGAVGSPGITGPYSGVQYIIKAD